MPLTLLVEDETFLEFQCCESFKFCSAFQYEYIYDQLALFVGCFTYMSFICSLFLIASWIALAWSLLASGI